jgi:hypothetical protein
MVRGNANEEIHISWFLKKCMIHEVPYKMIRASGSRAFGEDAVVKRPMLEVILISGTLRYRCTALVDSGSDRCVFPDSFRRRLGLIDSDGILGPDADTGGGVALQRQYWNLSLQVDGLGKQIQTMIGFDARLDSRGHGVLGQQGFFENFRVAFDHTHGSFALEPIEEEQAIFTSPQSTKEQRLLDRMRQAAERLNREKQKGIKEGNC